MEEGFKSKFGPGSLKMSQYLRSWGILEAYEKLLTSLYTNGWPGDRSIYSYSAEEILRYGSKFQQEFKGVIGKEFEKKAKAIYQTKEEPEKKEDKPKNLISVRRDPIEVKSKNSLDLSIFDKPRVQLSRSSKGTDRFRTSNNEDDFVQLNLTKPEKKEIILGDDPDFTVDKEYYESEFQKAPEEDEDLLRLSMTKGHRNLEPDPVINTSSQFVHNDDKSYQKQAVLDDTHNEGQLKGKINQSQDDAVNIGRNDESEDHHSQDERTENVGPVKQTEGNDSDNDKSRENKSRSSDINNRPESKNSKNTEIKGEGDKEQQSPGNKTPGSKNSLDKSQDKSIDKSLKDTPQDKPKNLKVKTKN